jgi:hypothetical protein
MGKEALGIFPSAQPWHIEGSLGITKVDGKFLVKAEAFLSTSLEGCPRR